MKAILVREFGEPEVMRLEEVPDPKPAAGQVLVTVEAAGVNPVDAYIRAGRYGTREMPYTPGSDAAGRIEAVGEGVEGWSEGDRVYTSGTISGAYAEKALCESRRVYPLPERVSFQQGAGLGVPYGTAYRALFQRARALAGEVVLVHGASGGVGTAAVQLARAAGMTVIGTAGSEEGRRLASEQGSHHVLDHHDDGHFQKALDATGGRGVDVIIELLANENLAKDLTILAEHGRVAVIGSRGEVTIDPRNAMAREAAVYGVMLRAATEREQAGIYAAITAGLENGALSPIVGKELPLKEAARAHREVMEGPAYGKRVLIP
jgi:NADPH2:quinone reductase